MDPARRGVRHRQGARRRGRRALRVLRGDAVQARVTLVDRRAVRLRRGSRRGARHRAAGRPVTDVLAERVGAAARRVPLAARGRHQHEPVRPAGRVVDRPAQTRDVLRSPPMRIRSLLSLALAAGTVVAIAQGTEEPHFVQPKPSFVPLIAGADVFVTTGLDLELWVPALLDKAGNPRVSEGGRGYVAAYAGIPLLEVPASVSRSQGDIHVFGNPHIHPDPVNAIPIARNILAGLIRVAP